MIQIGRIEKETLRHDLLAGLTGAIAGAPQAMGFALVAGISPVYGLYTAIVSTIVAALACSSRFMTVAPTNALALVVFSTLERYTGDHHLEAMFVLTLLVGVFQLAFGLLGLGNLTRFVSNAVMTGFITGAGFLVILGQLPHLTGYEGSGVKGALPRLWDLLSHLNQIHLQTTLVGLSALGIIWYLHHTRLKSWATLIAIVLTTLFVTLANWDGVAVVEDISPIKSGLPALIVPDLGLVPSLLSVAMAMAVLGAVQSAAISSAFREDNGATPKVNRDFVGQGLSNIAGSFFQSMPAGGSIGRTAVNISSGAKTRWANVFGGVFVGAILLILGGLIEQITLAALAGHLVVAASGIIKVENIKLVWRVNWAARLAMVATFVSTFVAPLEYSIYIGVLLSLGLYAYTSAGDVKVVQLVRVGDYRFRESTVPDKLPDNEPIIFDISGNLYFAAVPRLEEILPMPNGSQRPIVILRIRTQEALGSTVIRFLQRYNIQLRACGGRLMLIGVSSNVRAQLERTDMVEEFGKENLFAPDEVIFGATERALAYAHTLLQASQD